NKQTPQGGDEVWTYKEGELVPLSGDRFAFISEGQGGDGHVQAGALSIHYLQRAGDSFTRIGGWPGIVVSGTWGNPPQWRVRTDLTPGPALVSEAGGTWQGYTCTWANLIELTPERPVVRIDQIPISYSDGGAKEEGESQTMQAVIIPGEKGRSLQVRYSGDVKGVVTYDKQGEVYKPAKSPELLTC
ncbi:hypothetical protein LTR94_031197, partial [Friedmanniomyces endolithicus]